MDGSFSEPVDWKAVAIAFAIWAGHFSVLWAANSIFPDAAASRWIALVATVAALAMLAFSRLRRIDRGPQTIPTLAMGLGGIAILFGALPALVG